MKNRSRQFDIFQGQHSFFIRIINRTRGSTFLIKTNPLGLDCTLFSVEPPVAIEIAQNEAQNWYKVAKYFSESSLKVAKFSTIFVSNVRKTRKKSIRVAKDFPFKARELLAKLFRFRKSEAWST